MFVVVFLDEILVYPYSEEEHINHLRVALQTLRDRQLYDKFSRYKVWMREVEFIDHVIFDDSIKIYPRKMEKMKNWSRPLSTWI